MPRACNGCGDFAARTLPSHLLHRRWRWRWPLQHWREAELRELRAQAARLQALPAAVWLAEGRRRETTKLAAIAAAKEAGAGAGA